MQTDPIQDALRDVEDEVNSALAKYPPFHSSYEGYAIILKEIDDLKEQIWMNQTFHNPAMLRNKAKIVRPARNKG